MDRIARKTFVLLLAALMIFSFMSDDLIQAAADDNGQQVAEESEKTESSVEADDISDNEDTPADPLADETDKSDAEVKEDNVQPEEKSDSADQSDDSGEITFSAETEGVIVDVTAPSDALPEGTKMSAVKVQDKNIIQTVREAVDNDHADVTAVDITFKNAEGREIQPEKPVQVTIKTDSLAEAESPVVVHVTDDGKSETLTKKDNKVEIDTQNKEVSFEAEHFSVYAVVPGSTGDEGRVTVNFIGKNGETIATVYVKNSDDAAALEQIVYDPGAGTLASNELFDGWSIGDPDYTAEETGSTIEDVRDYLEGLSITEGDELNIYARILKHYTITYYGETDGVVLGSETRKLLVSEDSLDYTVSMAYTPASSTQNFEGWNVKSGSGNITSAVYQGESRDAPYPNDTVLTITGDVELSVNAPSGHWLVFDENGKGATYNAPQFVKDGEVTHEPPIEMSRLGYTFGGWYKDAACTAGNEFDFGEELSDNTTIYAKWTQVPTANYTIIIWRQNLEGNGYDYVTSMRLSGNTNTTINTVTQQSSGDNAYARINGTDYRYTGFHLNDFDRNVTIDPTGTSVVNVYYDRTEYTLSFQVNGTYYEPATGTGGTQYGLYNGQYVRIYYNNGTWYRTREWEWYRYVYSNPYDGPRFVQNTGWHSVKDITALYGQSIGDNFPIVGDDGTVYNNGERWDPQDNDLGWNEVMVYVDVMPADDVVFRLDTANRPLKTMYYYVEALDSDTDTVTHKGTRYVLYKNISARYNGVTEEDYIELDGFTKADVAETINGATLVPRQFQGLTGLYYIASTTQDQSIYFFYSRDKYRINYMDGAYFDGNGVQIEDEPNRGQFKESEEIYFGADISSYDEGGSNYYSPEYSNYTFAGWYIDESCTQKYDFTTMPEDGVTVYAKWILNQYRVFLHPNAGTDSTLYWGSDDQNMNFRVSSGSKVSAPTGTRTGYDFVGWYLDEGCTQVFSADNYVLNDTTVTTPYDKAVDFTDPMDKWGNGATYNSDDAEHNDRFWITHKLDLYGKWRAVLEGAEGIGILYDLNGGSGDVHDTNLYPDNSHAVAQGAATPPDDTLQFLHWVVQRWDEASGGYVDTDTVVYPGANYTVLKSLAHDVELEGSTPEDPKHSYTMQLKAEYGPKETPTPTHITWYDNFSENPIEGTQYISIPNLQINEATPILPSDTFTRTGYTFIGWARVDTTDNSGQALPGYSLSPQDLDEDDLYLKYEDGVFKANIDGTWTEVTYVAADEVFPYHDMYAVWEKSIMVKVTKTIHGSYADMTKEFTFTPSETLSSEGDFTLGEGGEKVFENLVRDTVISVSEAEVTNYTASIVVKKVKDITKEPTGENLVSTTQISGADTGDITLDNDAIIEYTNTARDIVPTGITENSAPFIFAVLSMIAILAILIILKRLKDQSKAR